MANIELKVPDIGGYDDVPVIEVLVAVGDVVQKDQGLVTLESDKASMDVPSPVVTVSLPHAASPSTAMTAHRRFMLRSTLSAR